tara:strand:- start:42 stop:554 length:513 start_codon:yes stop_codon:yes gene_type:complete
MIETPFFDNTETIYQSVQSTTVHESGKALERRVAKYLDSMNIPYKRNSSGIDFIINGDIHVECKAQSQNGTISEKLPTCAHKYIKKYNLQGGDIYILHPYSSIDRVVGDHFETLEKVFDTKIHIIDWKDFTYLMNGGKFEPRKPYYYGKVGVQLTAPSNFLQNKFFNWNK